MMADQLLIDVQSSKQRDEIFKETFVIYGFSFINLYSDSYWCRFNLAQLFGNKKFGVAHIRNDHVNLT